MTSAASASSPCAGGHTGLPPWLLGATGGGAQSASSPTPQAAAAAAQDKSRQWWPEQDGSDRGGTRGDNNNNTKPAPRPTDDDETLDALTALCMQPPDSGQQPPRGLPPEDGGNTTMILDRTETHDSTATANLLPMLHQGVEEDQAPAGDTPLPAPPPAPVTTLEPGGVPLAAAGQAEAAAIAGGDDGDATPSTPPAAASTIVAGGVGGEEEDVNNDMPLVSKRTNPLLGIMCAARPASPTSNTLCSSPRGVVVGGGSGSPARHSRLPFPYSFLQPSAGVAAACSSPVGNAVVAGSNAFSTADFTATSVGGGGGNGEGPLLVGHTKSAPEIVVSSPTPGGSCVVDPWAGISAGGSMMSAADAYLLPPPASPLTVVALPSSVDGGLFAGVSEGPAASLGVRVLYVGVFLTPASRDVLLSMVPAVHPLLHGDHMTLLYRPSARQLLHYPLGAEVELRVLGAAANSRVQAVFVEAPAWLETSASASAHVTISVAAGGSGAKAVEAGQLIHDALQAAAQASAVDLTYYQGPGVAAGASAAAVRGGYQHFDEALPLLGRVGVRVALPSATAAALGWLHGAAAEFDEGGDDGGGSAEVEVVVYCVDDLVGSGCVAASREALEAYQDKHAGVLGAGGDKVPPEPVEVVSTPSSLALPPPPGAAPSTAQSQPSLEALLATVYGSSSNNNNSTATATTSTAAAAGSEWAAPTATAAATDDDNNSPWQEQSVDSPPRAAPPSAAGGDDGGGVGDVPCSPAVQQPYIADWGALMADDSDDGKDGGEAGGNNSSSRVMTNHSSPLDLQAPPAAAAADSSSPLVSPFSANNSPLSWMMGGRAAGAAAATPTGAVDVGALNIDDDTPVAAPSPSAAPAAAVAVEVEIDDDSSSNSSLDSPRSTTSSTSSADAVQFLSAVHVGDYVAVRPFVMPTECGGGEEGDGGHQGGLLQGYVCEFACDEPFQADGVLAVLTDNTIGYVAMVLDSVHGASGAAAAAAATMAAAAAGAAAVGGTSGGNSGGDAAASRGGGAGSPPTQSWAQLQAGVGASSSSGSLSASPTNTKVVSPGSSTTAAAGAGEQRRDDLQLWREFEALQQQHGESLCASILESCSQDLSEAIQLIKGQAGSFQAATALAAAGSPPKQQSAGGGSAGGSSSPAAAGSTTSAAAGCDEGLVRQLALSVGLMPSDALQLARLVPHLPAETVVQQLQAHKGDVGLAADALLTAAATTTTAQQQQQQNTSGSAANSPAAAATGGAFNNSHCSSPVEVRAGPGNSGGSKAAFLAGKDPVRVLAAQRLRDHVAPAGSLSLELAYMLLEEHGGNLHEAARSLSEMQTCELQARTAASSGAGSSSRTTTATKAAAASGGGEMMMSEADQLAILAAMGVLDAEEQQQQEGGRATGSSRKQVGSAVSPLSSSPLSQRPAPMVTSKAPLRGPTPQHYYYPYSQHQEQQQYPLNTAASVNSNNNSNAINSNNPASFYTAPPPPPPPRAQPQPPAMVVQQQQQDASNVVVQRAAKEVTDALYEKSRNFNTTYRVFMEAAQAARREGATQEYAAHLKTALDAKKQAAAAQEEAERIAWSTNNASSQFFQIDLHGLGVRKAVATFERRFCGLQGLQHPGGVHFRVIVGKGLHSEGNVPKIKHGILQYMEERKAAAEAAAASGGGGQQQPWGVTWGVDPANEGAIDVFIPASSGGDSDSEDEDE